jgi:hypothetical protein
MANRRFNTQVAQPRKALAKGGSAKPMGRAAQQGRRSRPKVDEKKGRHFRQHKSYDAPPSKITRAGKKDGGSLKAVDKEKNPGLAKLPTKVRNKMGFMKKGGRVKKMGGGMSTARKDMMAGYYTPDMGMKGGKMYKDGGKVGKKQQGYKDRKDESIAMRIRKPRTARQLKDSRDESYGKFGSKAKKSGKINR